MSVSSKEWIFVTPHIDRFWHFLILNAGIGLESIVELAVCHLKQTHLQIMLIYTMLERISHVTTFVTRPTHHFLQTVDEVTDDNTKAFELLEHGAQFLAGALTHICIHLICLLTYDVCSDGGTYIQNFSALADNISVIWRDEKRDNGANEQASKWMNNTGWWWSDKSETRYLWSMISCFPEVSQNTTTIPWLQCLLCSPKTDVQSVVFDLKNVSVWNGDGKSFRKRRQQGWLQEQMAVHKRAEILVFLVWWENHKDLINPHDF